MAKAQTAATLQAMIDKLRTQLSKVRNTYKAADAKVSKATRKKTSKKTAKRPQMNAQQRKATQAARDHAKKKR